ncbi:HNH endonuclease signature motif containing protein, partial [Mycobacterium sp. 1164985.4]
TAAAHMLYLLNQDGELSDEDRQALAYIRVGKQRPDGMRPFEGLLTPEAWATLEPLMERNAAPGMCNPADEHPCLDGEPTDEQIRNDTRTTGKRNHDALLALCKRMLTTQPTGTINGLPANVVITVSLTDLEKGTGHGLTAGGTRLPIADVLKFAAHSRPWLALFDGKGLPLHLGRARRTATLAQRLMLLAKHRGCTMPGCSASAYRSQVHHANQDWKDGGRTDIEDLTLACGPNNRMVETAGWTTRNRPTDGVTEWIPPPELDCGQSRTNNLHHPERIIDHDDP